MSCRLAAAGGLVLAGWATACAGADASGSRAAREAGAGPAMVFESRAHDFGAVLSGTRVRWRFRFRFAKGRSVRLEKVETSCSCTAAVVRWPRARSDWGEVEVTWKVEDRPGSGDKTVTLHVRAPEPREVVLHLKALVVKRGFSLEPRRLFLGRCDASGSVERRVRVRLVTPGRLRSVTRVSCSAEWIHAALREVRPADGAMPAGAFARAYELRVEVDGRRAPPGHFLEFVTLYSDAPRSPYVDLPIKGCIVRRSAGGGG